MPHSLELSLSVCKYLDFNSFYFHTVFLLVIILKANYLHFAAEDFIIKQNKKLCHWLFAKLLR